MARKNTKKSVKFYDEDVVNGCNLSYEYESVNGAKPVEIKVNGAKDGSSIFVSKNTSTGFTNFGGLMDVKILTAVDAEFTAIEGSFDLEVK